MLTKDLIRCRAGGEYLKPQFISTDDPQLLQYAARLLDLYQLHIGRSMEELEDAVTPIVNGQKDLKLAKGIHKVILDRAVFQEINSAEFHSARSTLFLAAAQQLKTGNLPEDPASVKEEIFRAIPGNSAANALKNKIYSDLPESAPLLSLKKTFPKEVLERYNLALVQSLILFSNSLKIELIAEDESGKLRKVFQYLRFFRLLHSAEMINKKIILEVNGPASIFENSQKYGLQLASFFPAVCAVPHWKCACSVSFKGAVRKLSLDEKSSLVCRYSNFSAYQPEEFRMFLDLFRSKCTDWIIDDAPGYYRCGPQKIIFPDFVLRSGDGKQEIYLELFHRWHSSQLQERLEFCRKNPKTPLLIGVDRALLKKDGVLKEQLDAHPFFQKHGFLFRDFPGVDNVCKLLHK